MRYLFAEGRVRYLFAEGRVRYLFAEGRVRYLNNKHHCLTTQPSAAQRDDQRQLGARTDTSASDDSGDLRSEHRPVGERRQRQRPRTKNTHTNTLETKDDKTI